MTWLDAGPEAALPEGGRLVVEQGGVPLAVVLKLDGELFAVEGHCPHRGGEMGQGDLAGYKLACPLHAWCFDVRTGEAFFPRGAKLRTFRVEAHQGRLRLELP